MRDLASSAPAPGDMVADRFRLTAHLGSGGMGSVFAAEDQVLASRVALKFLPRNVADDPGARRRFYREVALTRAIRSPFVCQVYDVGECGGRPFLSMEYVDGESLGDLFARRDHVDIAQAHEIAAQTCAGLRAAHEAGVLHRDLKPANVLVNRSGQVRLTDFGLARPLGETDGDTAAGTPATMAPEQLVGRGASVKSDLFSLGLVLYELYTGRPAVTARTIEELVRDHEEFLPLDPALLSPDLDTGLARVLAACLEVDPELRPRTAADVGRAVERARRRGPWGGRSKLVATLPALVLGLAAAVAGRGETEPAADDGAWVAHTPAPAAVEEPERWTLVRRALRWAHERTRPREHRSG